jgi:hypothetical protein
MTAADQQRDAHRPARTCTPISESHCSSAGADGYREGVDRAFNEYR